MTRVRDASPPGSKSLAYFGHKTTFYELPLRLRLHWLPVHRLSETAVLDNPGLTVADIAPRALPRSICRPRVEAVGAMTSPPTGASGPKVDALQALCVFWAQNGRDVRILASLVRHVYTHQRTGP